MKTILILGVSALCIAVVCLVACSGQNDAQNVGSLRTVDRVLDDPFAEGSGETDVVENVEVFSWSFGGTANSVDWQLLGIELDPRTEGQGVVLQSNSIDPQIVLDVDFDSQSVDTIEVVFRKQPSDSAIELFWSTKGRIFRAGRKVTVFKSGSKEKEKNWAYSFAVGKHPRWNGSIDKIRIDPTDQTGVTVDLISVSGFKEVVRPALVSELAMKELRIDQCGDIRNGRVIPPGIPISLPIDIPENAKLRFSYGIQDGVTTPVKLRMYLSRGDDSELLFEEVIGVEEPFQCLWHEKVIDLGSIGKGKAELVFETQTENELDLALGFPVVSQIELLAPVPEMNSPNVVLIVLDTLRADRMSLYGYEKETTANITAWANRGGVVFENTITDAPWTLPSHVALFTGLNSLSHGMTAGDPIPAGLEMIAERLQKHGYRTAAFTGGGYLSEKYNLMQGFDTLSYWFTARREPEETGNDIEAGVKNALGWLKQTQTQAPSQPFMLFFHSYEVHTPYRERQPFFSQFHTPVDNEPLPPVKATKGQPFPEDGFRLKKLFTAMKPGEKPRYQPLEDRYIGLANDLYDSGVAFADLNVGKLLSFLETSGLSKNTVVVLTADHGESLGEKGLAGHSSLEEWEIRIPLVIAAPGIGSAPGSRVPTQARLIDIMPTILDLVGVEVPSDIDGVSLLPAIRGESEDLPGDAITYASSSNFGLALHRGNHLKYEFNNSPWEPVFATERLFLLDEDPLCGNNVASKSADTSGLRTDLQKMFNEKKIGLRMAFFNNSMGNMTVSLSGDLAKPLNVKSVEHEADALQWARGVVHFSVKSGTQRTLFFEGRPFADFSVKCDIEGSKAGTFRTTTGLESPDDSWQVVHMEAGWKEDDGTDLDSHTGIRAWIRGWPSDQVSSVEVDQQTVRILRELGYVE